MRPGEQLHTCTLCGRGCRYARSVCSTCRDGAGLVMPTRRAGWASTLYPAAMRRRWPAWQLRRGHGDYFLGKRDPLTVARESEYNRRCKARRAVAS